jgi:hypothetical protein
MELYSKYRILSGPPRTVDILLGDAAVHGPRRVWRPSLSPPDFRSCTNNISIHNMVTAVRCEGREDEEEIQGILPARSGEDVGAGC